MNSVIMDLKLIFHALLPLQLLQANQVQLTFLLVGLGVDWIVLSFHFLSICSSLANFVLDRFLYIQLGKSLIFCSSSTFFWGSSTFLCTSCSLPYASYFCKFYERILNLGRGHSKINELKSCWFFFFGGGGLGLGFGMFATVKALPFHPGQTVWEVVTALSRITTGKFRL